MRLDKFLCDAKGLTRSEAKALIKKKKVIVNNKLITDTGFSINELLDIVFVDNEQLTYKRFRYYLLNKPAGYVSATKDNHDKTVLDLLIDVNTKDCFPIGRLDKDTEGLLIISNDGELAHKLLTPKKHAPKTYYAKLTHSIDDESIHLLEQGIDIGEKRNTLPCSVERLSSFEVNITLTEGKFHQVKRMFEAVSNKVEYLKRVSFGTIKLDTNLEIGKYRELTEEEISSLYELVK